MVATVSLTSGSSQPRTIGLISLIGVPKGILLHGWPGSFLEFLPTLKLLQKKYNSSSLPYHVIVPSLPGYTLSSGPSKTEAWNSDDAAHVINNAITALGFNHADEPFLTVVEKAAIERVEQRFLTPTSGAAVMQSTRPATVGEAKQTKLLQKQVDWQEEQTRAQTDQRVDECLGYLCDLDPRVEKDRIEKTKGGLLEDLYCWVLENRDFKRWRTGEQDARLLWINAEPGKGKTMLMCGIMGQLEKEKSHLVSYFLCQATDPRLNNATAVLRGLLYLLLNKRPSLILPILRKYNKIEARFSKDKATFWEVSRIFKDVLNDPELPSIILAIDALDECTTQCQNLLDFISETSTFLSVRWFVSSRNEPVIREGMMSISKMIEVQLELNQEAVTNAVNTYIYVKVKKLAHDKRYNSKLKEEVEAILKDRAGDTFLWVALVCQQLADVKLLRNTLNKLNQFPQGLQKLYHTMLDSISGSECSEPCEDMLAVMTTAYRPLTLSELRALTESPQEFDDLDVLIASCGSFLTLRDDVVYFVHQSAQQFLERDWLGKTGASLAKHHQVLFSRSLNLLSETLRRDIYDLEGRFGPGVLIDEVPPRDHDPLAACWYSCIHWIDHLCDCTSAEELRSGDLLQDGSKVHTFFQTKYVYWLEALSLLDGVFEGVRAVRKLLGVMDILSRRISGWSICGFRVNRERSFVPSQLACLNNNKAALLSTGSSIIEIWDTAARTQLQTLRGHKAVIYSIAISPTTNQLASTSEDKTIKVWDTPTSMPVCFHTLHGHAEAATTVVFSHDGLQLCSLSSDTAMVWDITTGTSFSRSGQRLAISTDQCEIYDLEEDHGHLEPQKIDIVCDLDAISFSEDDRYIACSEFGTITVWDVNSGNRLLTFISEVNIFYQLQFQQNNSHISTELGMVSLASIDRAKGYEKGLMPAVIFSGYGISTDRAWIMKDGKRLLSLPPDYRPAHEYRITCAVHESTVTIAPRSGDVFRMEFRWDGW
ncbi:NWD1 [Fusarium albosuccineum]|uniref:NWD1 n=1 Tax=Fusarium albosuccineum TaxID=1237068 RepID=A0A8H4L8S2_9HYPO|nr:NWD1 [Fusarium albosuccineum]